VLKLCAGDVLQNADEHGGLGEMLLHICLMAISNDSLDVDT
jgi:hypothetical protein